jgi:hypothetical protein
VDATGSEEFRRGLSKDGVLKWDFMAYGCKKFRSAIEGM